MSEPKFMLRQDGRQSGPFTRQHIKGIASSGKLRPGDELRDVTSDNWQKASDFADLTFRGSTIGPPPVSNESVVPTEHGWWYREGGSQKGPVSTEKLCLLLQTHQIPNTTQVWRKGIADWLPVDSVPEFAMAEGPGLEPRQGLQATSTASTESNAATEIVVSDSIQITENSPEQNQVSFFQQFEEGGKIAAAISLCFGFVGDVLSPLGPWTGLMLGLSLVGCCGFGFAVSREIRLTRSKPGRLLPEQLFVFSLFLCVTSGLWFCLSLVTEEEDRGVIASTIPGVAGLQDALLGLKQDVAAVKGDTSQILRDTGEIKSQLGKIGEGGIIKDPKTPTDFYHNARFHELEGKFGEAFTSYERYLESDQQFVDPYVSYLRLLQAQKGAAAARAEFARLEKQYPENRALRLTSLLQLSGETKRTTLEDFVGKNLDFGPGFLVAADSFSAQEYPTRSAVALATERDYLQRFVEADENGNVQSYYLDKQLAIKLVAEARGRLNLIVNEGKTFSISAVSAGKEAFSINDYNVSIVFCRFEGQSWIQMPEKAINKFRSPIGNITQVLLPVEQLKRYRSEQLAKDPDAQTTLYVRYEDNDGRMSAVVSVGPFAVNKILGWQMKQERRLNDVRKNIQGAKSDVKEDLNRVNKNLEGLKGLPKIRIPSLPKF